MTGRLETYGETDFIVIDEKSLSKGKKVLLVNSMAASNIPYLLMRATIKDDLKNPIGYVLSKHTGSQPHAVLSDFQFGWPMFRYKDIIFIDIRSNTLVSHDLRQQKNEWLFNYPPARDIANWFAGRTHIEQFANLTTWALNPLFKTPVEADTSKSICIEGKALRTNNAPESLQSLWGWLPTYIYSLIGNGDSTLFIVPSETNPTGTERYQEPEIDTYLEEAVALLRENGFNIPFRVIRDGIGLYNSILSDVSEALSNVAEQRNEGQGVMFQ